MTTDKKQKSVNTQRMPLQERVKEKRRLVYLQAINEAAERVFAEKGAGDSRMPEIAAEAGISLGTMYGIIDGKDSLFHGIHKLRTDEFLDCISDARDEVDGILPGHLAVLRSGALYFLNHSDFLRICCRDGYGWAASFPASGPGKTPWNEGTSILHDLFTRGIEENTYVGDDPELLVRKMLALQQVELTHWVEHGMETPHEIVLARLEDQFVRAFCTPESQQLHVAMETSS
ncbi:MAG: TetR/AcrR family transcriptional regulator [Halieaceae bacterium]|jgi:AcrR family transcriptional regulator|nr:TetR/AcrR family transcriptional regulator [Halieaceae bacterium]